MSTNDELRGLLAKATPGPWEVSGALCGDHGTETVSIYHTDTSKGFRHIHEVVETGCVCGDEAVTPANAALIVAAVNALPALLDRIEALEGDNGNLEQAYRLAIARAERAETENARLREALRTIAEAAPKGRHDEDFDYLENVANRALTEGATER
jgi:uncharacterized protein (UPF0335 family)